MISRQTIAQILDTARIEEVVGHYVNLRKRGANLWGLCPFHDEKTPSFSVAPQKGIFKCFGCGKGGDAITFIKEIENVDYAEAIKRLGKMYNIEVQDRKLTDEEQRVQNDRESMFLLNEFACRWFEQQLWETDEGRSIGLSYIVGKRGMKEKLVRDFHVGYCPDRQRDALARAALAAGYKKEFLLKTGLCLETSRGMLIDRFSGRIIFPTYNISGRVVAFGGRIMVENKDKKLAKYVNSIDSEIYHKQDQLYGLFQSKKAISDKESVFLVEGYLDVMSMHQNGLCNVVASSGTALTEHQIALLHRFTDNITVLYDGDAAGIHAAIRGIDMLLANRLNVKVLLLPDGDDPDSFSHKHDSEYLERYFNEQPTDFITFKCDLLLKDCGNDVSKRHKALQEIINTLAIIPDPLAREFYGRDCAARFGIDYKTVNFSVERLRRQEREKQQQRLRYQQMSLSNAQAGVDQPDDAEITETAPTAETTQQQQPKRETYVQESAKVAELRTKEQVLVKALLRVGNQVFTADGDKPLTCGQFIIQGLEKWNISFATGLYRKILEEYKQHFNDEDFDPRTFFYTNPDDELRLSVAELLNEQEKVSGMHNKVSISEHHVIVDESRKETEIKVSDVSHYLYEYLERYVDYSKECLVNKIRSASIEQQGDLWRQYDILSATQNQIKQVLNRVL